MAGPETLNHHKVRQLALTLRRPPRMRPTTTSAKFVNLWMTPPATRMLPARMNSSSARALYTVHAGEHALGGDGRVGDAAIVNPAIDRC